MARVRSVNVQVMPYMKDKHVLVHMSPSDAIIYNTYYDDFFKLKKFINTISELSYELKYALTISDPKNSVLFNDLEFINYAMVCSSHVLLDYIEHVKLQDLSIEPFKHAFCENPWIFLNLDTTYIIEDVVDAWLDHVNFPKLYNDYGSAFKSYCDSFCKKIQKLNKSLMMKFFNNNDFIEYIYNNAYDDTRKFIDDTIKK